MGRTQPFDPPDLPDLSFLRSARAPRLEREADADLPDALLRPLEVAGERRRLQQVLIRRTGARDVDVAIRPGRIARVERVEQVEYLADRFDVRAAAESEHLRDADVQL